MRNKTEKDVITVKLTYTKYSPGILATIETIQRNKRRVFKIEICIYLSEEIVDKELVGSIALFKKNNSLPLNLINKFKLS